MRIERKNWAYLAWKKIKKIYVVYLCKKSLYATTDLLRPRLQKLPPTRKMPKTVRVQHLYKSSYLWICIHAMTYSFELTINTPWSWIKGPKLHRDRELKAKCIVEECENIDPIIGKNLFAVPASSKSKCNTKNKIKSHWTICIEIISINLV